MACCKYPLRLLPIHILGTFKRSFVLTYFFLLPTQAAKLFLGAISDFVSNPLDIHKLQALTTLSTTSLNSTPKKAKRLSTMTFHLRYITAKTVKLRRTGMRKAVKMTSKRDFFFLPFGLGSVNVALFCWWIRKLVCLFFQRV